MNQLKLKLFSRLLGRNMIHLKMHVTASLMKPLTIPLMHPLKIPVATLLWHIIWRHFWICCLFRPLWSFVRHPRPYTKNANADTTSYYLHVWPERFYRRLRVLTGKWTTNIFSYCFPLIAMTFCQALYMY